ncbi:MAG: N-acetylmuramoyl-L-alanine amidase [Lachnospiraceae bacterium]|nr:N-acetylmuramoyl-L-alanine amidase [Lachnospiraceae bacterium]
MEEKVIKFTAGMLMCLTVVFSVMYMKLPDVKAWAIARESMEYQPDEQQTNEQENMNNLALNDTEIVDGENHMQLRVVLPSGVNGKQVEVSNNYLTQTIRIEIPHTDDSYFENYPITGSSDHIEGLSYAQGKKEDIIEITMDRVYEVVTEYDEQFYYLDFITPQELYEYVVVVDAGHGGNDGGAEKSGILEKNIDLAIVLALKELLDASDENIKVYYTRTDDSNPSYERRVGLANKSDADLFISVHNNSYRRSSAIKGTEVMYSESFEGVFTSERLAEICMEELTDTLGSRDRGLLEGDNIYIIKNSEVPVALIEVGFMTNKEELRLLNSAEYQEKTAEAIYQAIFRALDEIAAIETE